MAGWTLTDVSEVRPCGCQFGQQVEDGAVYHERWMLTETCIDHARRCPDDGRCWHVVQCGEGPCWRVENCGPMTGVFPGDEWPTSLVDAGGSE